jgi:putative FmdB family regulatory protein
MALYEYECVACGHRFEVIQKMSDPPVEKCPVCGKPVRKLQSAPAFQFKGSGWYVTDYARKDGAKTANDGASDANKSKTETSDKPAKTESAEKPASAGSTTKS